MRKNVAGQVIVAQLINATDGSAITSGIVTVYVTGDGGVQGQGAGTIQHEGNGAWSYFPTQNETNFNHIAFTFIHLNAVPVTINVYPLEFGEVGGTIGTFPITGPYVTENQAQAYFDERLRTEAWDDASSTDRNKALKMATKSINRLNFIGSKTDSAQENQFPRDGDTVVPQSIRDACCEIALALLDGVNLGLEKANLAASSQGIGDARATYDRVLALPHIAAGIVSVEAWDLLRPFLRDPGEVIISRDS